jgi:hypothetical protein
MKHCFQLNKVCFTGASLAIESGELSYSREARRMSQPCPARMVSVPREVEL